MKSVSKRKKTLPRSQSTLLYLPIYHGPPNYTWKDEHCLFWQLLMLVCLRADTQTHTHTKDGGTKHVVATCQVLQSNATVWVQPAVCRNKNVAREWWRVSCRLFVCLSFLSYTSLFSPFFPPSALSLFSLFHSSPFFFFKKKKTSLLFLLSFRLSPHLSLVRAPSHPYPPSHTSGELSQNKTRKKRNPSESGWHSNRYDSCVHAYVAGLDGLGFPRDSRHLFS